MKSLCLRLGRGLPALAIGLCVLSGGEAAPAPLPVETFAALPDHDVVRLSPDGRYVSAKRLLGDGRYGLIVYDLTAIGTKPPFATAMQEDWDINWIAWKGSDRLLVSARTGGIRYLLKTVERRLVAMNPDGSKPTRIAEQKMSENYIPQLQDNIVDMRPDDPRNVLMGFNASDPSRPRLFSVDVFNDKRATIETGRDAIQWWLLDQQGEVRIAAGRLYSKGPEEGTKTYYRPKRGAEWVEIWDDEKNDAAFLPVLFDADDADLMYVLSEHETGRMGLYKFRLSTRAFTEQIFLHPEVDVARVLLDPLQKVVEGVEYVTDLPRVEWFAPAQAAVQREVEKKLPGWAIRLVSSSWDGKRYVVLASASDHSARYYLYDAARQALRYLAPTQPKLDTVDLARVLALPVTARDGTKLPAYLTLPRGSSNPPAAPLPTVILPHDPPTFGADRDSSAYDPIVQMLANRGYAVLQMNFRGSAGYGKKFREAGWRQWGTAIQTDIADGTALLVKSGIADPTRICIAGFGYAGYLALMGATTSANTYRCAVSVGGISDLPEFLMQRRFFGSRDYFSRTIGRLVSDREALARDSPRRRAEEIKVPVLLLHGTEDRMIAIAQSRSMASALKSADKPYRFVELEDEYQDVVRWPTRLQMFREIDDFLAQHLAPK